jgi:hypothetical protein
VAGYVVRGYESIEAFYAEPADPLARERSAESDYGVHWTDPLLHGQLWAPPWRVALVFGTGEVYAACHMADGTGKRPVRLYGVIPGWPGVGRDEAWDSPAMDACREAAERFLDGWADRCGPGGLWWLEGLFRDEYARRRP